MQKRVLDINPQAFFVPCSTHSLNLVVNDAASSWLLAVAFFDLVQQLFVFFSASARCWDVLKRHIPNLPVKPVSETRWASRIDVLTPLQFQIGTAYDALLEIADDCSFTESSGNRTRFEAQGIAKNLADFRFIACLVMWYHIVSQKILYANCFNDKTSRYKMLCRTRQNKEIWKDVG